MSTAAVNPPSTANTGQAPPANALATRRQAWQDYPRSLPTFNQFAYNHTKLRARLRDEGRSLFDATKTDVHITDVNVDANHGCTKNARMATQASEVDTHFTVPWQALRVISIIRKTSLEPLQISQDLLLKILHFYNIGPQFLDLLFAFRNVEELSDIGQSFWSPLRSSASAYGIDNVPQNLVAVIANKGVKWSERQIGVYHRFGRGEKSIMVLLHANDTEAYQRIQHTLAQDDLIKIAVNRPLSLHVMIVSSYLDNWRWYMNEHGRVWGKTEVRLYAFRSRPQALDFEEMQQLRNDEARLLTASTTLAATQKTIERLIVVSRAIKTVPLTHDSVAGENAIAVFESDDTEAFKALLLKCQGYQRVVDVLQARVGRLIKLLADGLDQQSQKATANIADSTFKLTERSVEDNTVVKVVTIITVIYLPTQFVATFFGMNLMSLPEPGGNIKFAGDWWLFLAVSLPLTLLTLAIVVVARMREKYKRKRSEKIY